MGVKKALDILEPFEITLEKELRDLRKRSEILEIHDDDSRFKIETKEIEEKHLHELEEQATILKLAIKELKNEMLPKKPRKRKSPLTLRGY